MIVVARRGADHHDFAVVVVPVMVIPIERVSLRWSRPAECQSGHRAKREFDGIIHIDLWFFGWQRFSPFWPFGGQPCDRWYPVFRSDGLFRVPRLVVVIISRRRHVEHPE